MQGISIFCLTTVVCVAIIPFHGLCRHGTLVHDVLHFDTLAWLIMMTVIRTRGLAERFSLQLAHLGILEHCSGLIGDAKM